MLLGSSPPANTVVAEPPDEVMLVFNQPVFTAAGAVTVLDTDDRSVHAGTAQRVSDGQAVRLRPRANPAAKRRTPNMGGRAGPAVFLSSITK